jgi:hypothetical protein
MLTKPKRTHIASSIPGRTRIRVSRKRRTKAEMDRIARALKDHLGDVETHADVRTGSILVRHPHQSTERISSILQDLGVILGSVADIHIPDVEGKTGVDFDLADAVSDLNRRLGFATGGLIDLRVIIPLGFGALALLQLLRRGLQFEAAPWYLLAYAAFDSFVKLHQPAEHQATKCTDAGLRIGAIHSPSPQTSVDDERTPGLPA